MIDKICKINNNNAIIVFTDDHPPLRLYSSEGNVVSLLLWLLSSSPLTLQEYDRALVTQTEGTDPCIKIAS